MTMRLKIGKRTWPVASLKEASEKFSAIRDARGVGASKMPAGLVLDADKRPIGRVSYNGRVWPVGEWTSDQKPIYDNREEA